MHEDQIYQKCSCTGHHQGCEHTVNKIEKRKNFFFCFFSEWSHSDEWHSQMLLCLTSSTWCISANTAFSFATYYTSLIQKHILLLYCSIYFPVWDEHYNCIACSLILISVIGFIHCCMASLWWICAFMLSFLILKKDLLFLLRIHISLLFSSQ